MIQLFRMIVSSAASRRLQRAGVILFAGLTFAAMTYAAPLHYGVRAGMSAATVDGEFQDLFHGDHKLGLDLGVSLAWDLAPGFAIQTGAQYVNKGTEAEIELTDGFGNSAGTFTVKWNLDYVEVPVLLRVDVMQQAMVRPYLEAGPSVGIRLGGEFDPGIGSFPGVDLKDDLRVFDLGYSVGAGVMLPFHSGRLGLGARYTSAFSDAYDLDNNLEARNRTWSFAVSWMK